MSTNVDLMRGLWEFLIRGKMYERCVKNHNDTGPGLSIFNFGDLSDAKVEDVSTPYKADDLYDDFNKGLRYVYLDKESKQFEELLSTLPGFDDLFKRYDPRIHILIMITVPIVGSNPLFQITMFKISDLDSLRERLILSKEQ
jgi:hypothetical protein